MNCFIYTITCLINNKVYVGYTTQGIKRFDSHRTKLLRNTHPNEHLQGAWNLHGETSFIFEILVYIEKEFLCSEEHYWCNLLNAHNNVFGYNMRETHPHKIISSQRKHTEKTKLKLKKAWIKRKNSDQYPKLIKQVTRLGKTMKGIKKKKEAIEKQREKMKDVWDKKTTQLTKNNEIVDIFENQTEAAKHLVNLKLAKSVATAKTGICECANGNIKSSYGFIWRHYNELEHGNNQKD